MTLNGVTGDVTFGAFRLDVHGKALYRGDSLVTLGSRALEVLCVLVASAGELVTKDALMERVWPGIVVEENNIQVQIWSLRKALGKTDDGRDFIVTVPGRGYRFAAAAPRRAETTAWRDDDELPPLPDRPSIAVLPFANMSGDPGQEHFADGMVEDIITDLSRLRWLFVI